MGFAALFFYGLGDILGAGIYALVGPASAVAGSALWLSFSIALVVASLTALSYSEMCSRFPRSGGVSVFASEAFSAPIAGFISGWLLFFVSVVSMATLARAFQGYFAALDVATPAWIVIGLFLIAMGLINFRGLREASWFNILSTCIELSGLLLILFAGASYLSSHAPRTLEVSVEAVDVFKGAALLFYAFIGFEDLANVAEEVKEPERNIPRAIMGSLSSAGVLYLLIGVTATAVAGPELLASSSAPLLEVIQVSGVAIPGVLFSLIALFAVSNTCLLNSITASRLLFGLSEQRLVPQVFGRLHARYHTPWIAIVFVTVATIGLSVFSSLKTLAGATSVLILIVFAMTNVSLLKIASVSPRTSGFRVPRFVPVLALLANVALVAVAPRESLEIAATILVGGFAVYLSLKLTWHRRENSAR